MLRICLLILLAVFYGAPSLAAGKHQKLIPGLAEHSDYRPVARPAGIPSDQSMEQQGLKIGRILIQANNIFDTGNPRENTRLFRLGNRLHVKTRPATIRRYLLFRSGDRYRGRLLSESERLLRQRRYLHDARIRPVRIHDGLVDIEVITDDVWTLKPGISFGRAGGKNTAAIEFEEINLLGRGAAITLSDRKGIDRDSLSFTYHDPTVGYSWWDLFLGYSDNSDGKSQAVSLQRPFYALDSRWSAELSWQRFERTEPRYDLGRVIDEYQADQHFLKLGYGWSGGLQRGWTSRWRAGATMDENLFSRTASTHHLPADRTLIYPWLSWTREEARYYKDHNRDQINRTEDVALGWKMHFLAGYASRGFGADRDSLILRSSLRKAERFADRRTLNWQAALQGRHEHDRWANVIFNTRLRYHDRQSSHRTFYAAFGADATSRLDDDDQVLLGGDSGLRGYPLRYQAGRGRWLLTLEQRFFSRWYPFRLFNVGGAVFADVGRTWGRRQDTRDSLGILKDVGFGLRLGNSRSGLGSVIHLDFAFPLDGDDSLDKVQFLVVTKNSF